MTQNSPCTWRLRFICCGRDDGEQVFATREEAEAFRESYTSGFGVEPHGYSAEKPNGHVRAAILTRQGAPLADATAGGATATQNLPTHADSVPPEPSLESVCRRCGGPNLVWHAPSPLWNYVMRDDDINAGESFNGIICMNCFATIAETAGTASFWRVFPERVNVLLKTVTPTGRVWDEQWWMWREPPPRGNAEQPGLTLRERLLAEIERREAAVNEGNVTWAQAQCTHYRRILQRHQSTWRPHNRTGGPWCSGCSIIDDDSGNIIGQKYVACAELPNLADALGIAVDEVAS